MKIFNPVLNHISTTRFTIKAAGLFTVASMMNKSRLESVRKGEAQFRPMIIPTLIGLSAALEFTQALRAFKAFKHTKSLYALMHSVNASASGLQMIGYLGATYKLLNPWWLKNSHYRALIDPKGPYNHCLNNNDAPKAAKIESLIKGSVNQFFSYPPIEEALEIGKTVWGWMPNLLTKHLPEVRWEESTLKSLHTISDWYAKGNGTGITWAKLPHAKHQEWSNLVAHRTTHISRLQEWGRIAQQRISSPILGVGLTALTGLSIFLDARQKPKWFIGTFFASATIGLYFKRPTPLSPTHLFKKSFSEGLGRAASISGRYVAPSESRMQAISSGLLAMRFARGLIRQ